MFILGAGNEQVRGARLPKYQRCRLSGAVELPELRPARRSLRPVSCPHVAQLYNTCKRTKSAAWPSLTHNGQVLRFSTDPNPVRHQKPNRIRKARTVFKKRRSSDASGVTISGTRSRATS
jgi:hypothetical protein